MSVERFAGAAGARGRRTRRWQRGLGWDVIGRGEPGAHAAGDRVLMKTTMVLLIILYLVVLLMLLAVPSTTAAHCGLPQHRTLDAATLEPRRGCAEHSLEIWRDPARIAPQACCADGYAAEPCTDRPSLPDRRDRGVEHGTE